MKKYIVDGLILIGLSTIVTLGWYGLELAMIGNINPNSVDSIIALILVISLYINLLHWIED
jgi:purine-cytosine permease-like protein